MVIKKRFRGNKKIKNATPITYNGVNFKSRLERSCYELLVEAGYDPQYEQVRFRIFDGCRLDLVHAYLQNAKKQLEESITKKGLRMKIMDMYYTPDFYLEHKGYAIIIETKGFANDSYSRTRKMFLKLLNQMGREIYFF